MMNWKNTSNERISLARHQSNPSQSTQNAKRH